MGFLLMVVIVPVVLFSWGVGWLCKVLYDAEYMNDSDHQYFMMSMTEGSNHVLQPEVG